MSSHNGIPHVSRGGSSKGKKRRKSSGEEGHPASLKTMKKSSMDKPMLNLDSLNIYVSLSSLQEELRTPHPNSGSKEPGHLTKDVRKRKAILNDPTTDVDRIVLNRDLNPEQLNHYLSHLYIESLDKQLEVLREVADSDEVAYCQLYQLCYLSPCIYL